MSASTEETGRRPTIKAVAAAAGVSTAAVSQAFNHKGRLSEATRRRILDAALELTVDGEELVQRLLKRAETSGRADDTEEVIRERQELYVRETAPLAAAYTERGLLVQVDGMGSIDEVEARIGAALDEVAAKN